MGNKNTVRTTRQGYSTKGISVPSPAPVKQYDSAKLGIVRVGSDRPNYRSVISQGGSATNSLVSTKYRVRRRPGIVQAISIKGPSKGQTGYSFYCGLGRTNAPEYANVANSHVVIRARDQANMRLRQKIRGELTTFQGLTFLGELREAIQMVRSPARTLRLRTGQFIDRTSKHRRKPGFTRTLADSWLEFSFGVSPLMHDISSAADAILRFEEPRLKRVTVVTEASDSVSTSQQNGVGGLAIVARWCREDTVKASVRFTAGMKMQASRDYSAAARLVQYGGFNLSEIIPTAWELVPWSFLIDYFSNIGDVLSAATVSLSSVQWYSRTTVLDSIRIEHSLKYGVSDPTQLVITQAVPPLLVATTQHIVRDNYAPGIPSVRLDLPGRNVQFLNIGALIAASKLR